MDLGVDTGMTPGQRIKLYRQRAGLTQEVAAQLKGVTVSAWRKWESGERSVTSLGDWIEIARILKVRDLYRLTGLPVGSLPDEQAEHETVAPVRAALHAYAPKLDGPPDLDGLRRGIEWGWNAWYDSGDRYSRTGSVLPELITRARATVAAVEGEQRREALRATADLMMLVRAFGKRIGALDVSLLGADRALAAAGDADDPMYRAAAAWHMANVLSAAGHAEESGALCRDAAADLESIDDQSEERISLLGSLHLMLSIQEARLGYDRRAETALDFAERTAARTGETNWHHLYFGSINVGVHRSAVSLELSRSAEALRIAERIDVTRSPSRERQHSHYLHLARGYANQRDDLASVYMLVRADRAIPEESHLNLVMRALVRELLVRETPTTRPELRPLAERIGVA
ncbi:helix-turn-helix domain-containing protein [Micromonospora sp. NPDC050397]|uniref:helix-turn-helix domain-containing protein n=1 Tax=Micromonospora sp. NPDC050397 TaxID=3364279 RepID=UPI0038508DE2